MNHNRAIRRRLLAVLSAATATSMLVACPHASASFGLKKFDVTFANQDGSPATQVGSHPYAMTTVVELDEALDDQHRVIPAGEAKDLFITLPAGVSGDPAAVPHCTDAEFKFDPIVEGVKCPDSSAVGIAEVFLQVPNDGKGGNVDRAIYNLVPPPGVAAKLGFEVLQELVTIELSVSGAPPYNVIAKTINVPQPVKFFDSRLEVWGNPESPVHDAQRGRCAEEGGSCPSSAKEVAFLTLPTSCTGPLLTSWEADSWQEPGRWVSGGVLSHDNAEPPSPLGMTGCGRLGFAPTISALPTTVSAESPSGLGFSLDVADEGLTSPTGLSQSDIKKTVVALPEGMTANPALAEGLGSCTEADLAQETISSEPGVGCPEESKIGTVEVETPLLEETLKGSLFLATPYQNPAGSLLGLYVVVKNPETGVLLKLVGKVVPNETTGQLVTEFEDLPQLPFSHFRLTFRQGQRSPLVTPPACGTYTTTADLTPYAKPEEVLHDTTTFQVSSGIGRDPCPAGGVPGFKPGLVAGTLNNDAGNYSPLDIRLTRNDGEQEITGFSSFLPPGLTANLNRVRFCSEAQIAVARLKSGTEEEANPSCPQASEIGHTLVGVGVGSVLAYTPGKIYMAGPYEAAPFSVVAITAAKVGPFDLGTVVVHLPLQINPVTAAVSIPSGAADQIPHIIKGIVVHVRDIRVYVDRPNFTANPTNCSQLSFGATVIGSGANFATPSDDMSVEVDDRFQAANCANLAFKPLFKAATAGKTSRTNGASLSVKLAYPKVPQGGQADIKAVKVDLPKHLPSRLTTLQKACTSDQFNANPAGCPSASRVGHATAVTPILPVPLSGPAYFVSYGGAKFPELVIVLEGYGVTIDLHGETFINKAGITSSTFRTVPDQPVTSFELTLPQGKYSALAANGNLCTTKLNMPTSFTAQNGATLKQTTKIVVTGCPKHKTRKTKHNKKHRHAKKK